jgi:hypothetical protein
LKSPEKLKEGLSERIPILGVGGVRRLCNLLRREQGSYLPLAIMNVEGEGAQGISLYEMDFYFGLPILPCEPKEPLQPDLK